MLIDDISPHMLRQMIAIVGSVGVGTVLNVEVAIVNFNGHQYRVYLCQIRIGLLYLIYST